MDWFFSKDVGRLRRCVHTNWTMRVSLLWKFVCTHRCSYKTTSFEKEQFISYFYILKTFPSLHFIFVKIIINALTFMWESINGRACWTALLLWLIRLCGMKRKNALYKYSIKKNTISILVIYQKHQNVYQSVQNCSKKNVSFQLFNYSILKM